MTASPDDLSGKFGRVPSELLRWANQLIVPIIIAMILCAMLAGCSAGESARSEEKFFEQNVNGTRCIVYAPGSSYQGRQMECDFD